MSTEQQRTGGRGRLQTPAEFTVGGQQASLECADTDEVDNVDHVRHDAFV